MNRSNVLSLIVTVAAFGVLVPWWKGLEYLDPLLFIASILVSLVFVTPMITEGFSPKNIFGQASRAVIYAWTLALLVLIHGLVTVNVTHWFGHILLPPASIVFGSLLLNFAGASFLAALALWISLGSGTAVAKRTVRIAFFAVLACYFYLFRFAPPQIRSIADEQLTQKGLNRLLFFGAAILAVSAGLIVLKLKARPNEL